MTLLIDDDRRLDHAAPSQRSPLPADEPRPDRGVGRRGPGSVLLAPAAAVLDRISLAWKFVLIALVLAAPLGFVVQRYVAVREAAEEFSALERVGIEAVVPLFQLELVAVDARTAVSRGEPVDGAALDTAIAGVQEVVDAGVMDELGITEVWTELVADVELVRGLPTDDPAAVLEAFDTWDVVIDEIVRSIATAADASNLTLDPDLDTFYLMDIATTKAPALVDAAGAAQALQALPPSPELTTRLAIEQVRVSDAAAAIDAGLTKTVGATAAADVADEMQVLQERTAAAVAGLADGTADADTVIDTTAALGPSAAESLDQLIAVRIEGLVEARQTTLWVSALGMGLAVWLFAALFTSTRSGIGRMRSVLRTAAGGDLGARVELGSRDEFGALGQEIDATLDEQLRLEQEAAARDERERRQQAELRDAQQTQLALQEQQLAQAEELRAKVDEMLVALAAAAAGDLTVPVTVRGDDAIGRMGEALAKVLGDLRSNVGRIAASSTALAAAADELQVVAGTMEDNVAATSQHIERSTDASQGVARSVETVSVGIEEMSQAIREIARNSSEAAEVAATGVDTARRGEQRVIDLGERSNEIGAIVKVINGIAEQTNLLALNATIEAARAGEAGKGFAVVANEVKELASGTARATEDITEKIAGIQSEIFATVEIITAVAAVISQISEFQHTIAAAVEEQAATTSQIAHSAQEASTGAGDITQAMSHVHAMARGAASGASDSRSAASELSRMAAELQQVVGAFVY